MASSGRARGHPQPVVPRQLSLNNFAKNRLVVRMADKIRLDKWLWAARFYKTRSLAATEIGKGRVFVNEQAAKPSREVAPGDLVSVRKEDPTVHVHVMAVSGVRGPAPVARLLYEETPESIAARERAAEMRRLAPEPAREISAGRPTKRDRRQIDLIRNT